MGKNGNLAERAEKVIINELRAEVGDLIVINKSNIAVATLYDGNWKTYVFWFDGRNSKLRRRQFLKPFKLSERNGYRKLEEAKIEKGSLFIKIKITLSDCTEIPGIGLRIAYPSRVMLRVPLSILK